MNVQSKASRPGTLPWRMAPPPSGPCGVKLEPQGVFLWLEYNVYVSLHVYILARGLPSYKGKFSTGTADGLCATRAPSSQAKGPLHVPPIPPRYPRTLATHSERTESAAWPVTRWASCPGTRPARGAWTPPSGCRPGCTCGRGPAPPP